MTDLIDYAWEHIALITSPNVMRIRPYKPAILPVDVTV